MLDAVQDEASLGVEQQAEIIATALDRDNIHETSREVDVSSDFAVDLNELLHADQVALVLGKSVFQAVTQDEDKWQALTKLVGTLRRARGPHATELIHHPVVGGIQALQMFL